MKDKENKDNLTDLVEALPAVAEDEGVPAGSVRAEDGSIVKLEYKPGDWLLSLIKKASNQ